MALITRSSEISFSLSRLRSTLRSMSIASRSKLSWRVPELHLDGSRAERGVTETAAGLRVTVDVQGHLIGVSRDDPAPDQARIGDRDLDQAPTARRQCLGSVSGRSTPGEETSSV